MPSKTVICNMALGHCGITSRMQDVETENSNEAIQCRLFFDQVVGILLESVEWNFAKVFLDLQDIGSPPSGWSYRYMYPNTIRRINFIVNPAMRTPTSKEDKIPFDIIKITDTFGKAIVSDEYQAVACCNENITETELFDFTFTQAVALGLASMISTPLRVKSDLSDALQKAWSTWLGEAILISQAQTQPDPERDSQFVSGRS